MGELYAPTSADYAESNASDAKKRIKEQEHLILNLQERVKRLENMVNVINNRLGP